MSIEIYMFIYTFTDGTVLKLYEAGLSIGEVWALEALHGKSEMKYMKVRVNE